MSQTTGQAAETVTQAQLQVLDLPGDAGRIGLVTLTNGTARPATFGPGGLENLSSALDEALAAGVAAVGITGVGRTFCAGADLDVFTSVTDRADAAALSARGHAVFGRLADLGVPTFAFVNGTALGGGFEVALHCTHRTAAAGVRTLGLPEVGIGLIPGWGGTYLLPNLIGISAATKVIVDASLTGGRPFTAEQMAGFGAVDVVLDADDFLAQSLAWAAKVVTGDVTVTRADVDRDEAAWQAVIDASATVAESKLHGASPAPGRALQLLTDARTASRTDGFAAEDEALADLVMSDENRAALYSFGLTRAYAKTPAGAPDPAAAREVTSVGVVGAGLMAAQLAMLFATKLGVPVVMTDLDQARVDRGLDWIRTQAETERDKGRMTPDAAASLIASVTGSVDKSALASSDLVIEAVFEDLEVKKTMLAELEPAIRPDCLIVTNTSSLSLAGMASVLTHPERFVGMHFFNPVARMALLEIIPGPATDTATLSTAFVLGRTLGKSCVLVQDAPGFAANRLLGRMYSDVFATIDEGTPVLVADSALDVMGLPMSPMTLLALIGPAVLLHLGETLADAWPDRFAVSPALRAIVESGSPRVLGKGTPPQVVPEVEALLKTGDSPSTGAQVLARVRDGLADEARRMLDEGVVARPQDIDACMILGAGWPAHMGGLTPWLDRTDTTGARRFLEPGVASVSRA